MPQQRTLVIEKVFKVVWTELNNKTIRIDLKPKKRKRVAWAVKRTSVFQYSV